MTSTIERRGRRPWVERVWTGDLRGPAAWTLRALAVPYAGLTGAARTIAARSRRRVEGVTVVAVGGLAVGGAGKTTLARWAAREALARGLRPAILLRGYGSGAGRAPTIVPPDAAGWPKAGHVASLYGDEAVAHRAALPAEAIVIAGSDRYEGARLARDEGAAVVILDDGWEQGGLTWDALWIALDPRSPLGNGWTLPAGPLRRPPSNLRECNGIALIAEETGEADARAWTEVKDAIGSRPIVRFQRRVERWTTLRGEETAPPRDGVILVSSVGSPARLERFLHGAGVQVLSHVAFADHASWDRDAVAAALGAVASPGAPRAAAIVATDKDAVRARGLGEMGLPILLVSSGLTPLDDPAPLLGALRAPTRGTGAAVAAVRPIR